MAGIVKGSIDLTKIPKNKIVEGKKGKYLNVVITINNDADQYGNNASITVDQTPDERASKETKIYLGNAKTVWTDGTFAPAPGRENQQASNFPTQKATTKVVVDDDLPF